MNNVVELVGISKTYGRTQVLRNVSITCSPGSVHALVGENGAGKSTLLKILTGVVSPDEGSMRLDGDDIAFKGWDPTNAQQSGVAIVHQEFALLPNMTIAENIFLGRELSKGIWLDKKAQMFEAQELLTRVGCTLDPNMRIEDLSIADAQLVEIAKALSLDAKFLALDEPSAVLSGSELTTLFSLIENLKSQGVAILYVSHRMDELFRLCDQFTVLKDGEVTGSGLIADTNRDEIVRLMVGRDVSKAFPSRAGEYGASALELHDFLVDGLPEPVSLNIRAGEIVGLAGLGGSGRSRLMRGVFGLLPASGSLIIAGVERQPFTSPRDAMRAGLAFLPEDRKTLGLALSQSVMSNITLLNLRKVLKGGFLSPRKEAKLSTELINTYGIKSSSSGLEPVSTLSGGNQQKVVFGKWLQMNPDVVLLDEPTRGIDVAAKEEIYSVIRGLANQGVAFLLISSELIEVLGLSDRIHVMVDGQIVGELLGGSVEEDIMRLITATSHRGVEVDAV